MKPNINEIEKELNIYQKTREKNKSPKCSKSTYKCRLIYLILTILQVGKIGVTASTEDKETKTQFE